MAISDRRLCSLLDTVATLRRMSELRPRVGLEIGLCFRRTDYRMGRLQLRLPCLPLNAPAAVKEVTPNRALQRTLTGGLRPSVRAAERGRYAS